MKTQELPWFVVVATLVVMIALSSQIPLGSRILNRHPLKAVNNLSVAHNMVRYGAAQQFISYQVTPDNPTGNFGSILGHESPLGVSLLAAVFVLAGAETLDGRVLLGHAYALLHLIGTTLLLGFFVFRRRPGAWWLLTGLYLVSWVVLFWSTRPMAETYASFYLVVLLVTQVELTKRSWPPALKGLLLLGAAGLVCLGGKQNYGLVAAAALAVYPIADPHLTNRRDRWQLYAVFSVAALALIPVVLSIPHLPRMVRWMTGKYQVFTKPWYFPEAGRVLANAVADVGVVAWVGMVAGAATVTFWFFRRRTDATTEGRYRILLFGLVAGTSLNYLLLRHLFPPHNYYLHPTFLVLALCWVELMDHGVRWAKDAPVVAQFAARRGQQLGVAACGGLAVVTCGLLGGGSALLGSAAARSSVLDLLAWVQSARTKVPLDRQRWGAALAGELGILAVFAGILGIGLLVWVFRRRLFHLTPPRLITGVLGTLVLLQVATSMGKLVGYRYGQGHFERFGPAIEHIRRITQPDDVIITDKPEIAFYAERRSARTAVLPKIFVGPPPRFAELVVTRGPIAPKLEKYVERVGGYSEDDVIRIYRLRAPPD